MFEPSKLPRSFDEAIESSYGDEMTRLTFLANILFLLTPMFLGWTGQTSGHI